MPQYKSYKRKYSRSRRGKYSLSRKARNRRFQAKVKKAIMKTAETKYHILGGDDTLLYHDRGTTTATAVGGTQGALIWDPWVNIGQGTGARNRVGDEIYPRGMALRLTMYNAGDRTALFYRIIVCKLNRVINGTGMTGGNFDIFDANGANDSIASIVKNDQGVKVYYDKTFTVQGSTQWSVGADSTRKLRLFKKLFINPKGTKKIIYSAANQIVNNPLAVFVLPYDAYASLRTDNVANCQYSCKLYFKDV
jgi:hypothetical protein